MVKDLSRYLYDDRNGKPNEFFVEMSDHHHMAKEGNTKKVVDEAKLRLKSDDEAGLIIPSNGHSPGSSSGQGSVDDIVNQTAVVMYDKSNGKRAYISVLILFIINLLNYMDRFTVAGVLIDVQKFYGISDAEGGLLQTVFIVAYMLFAPICGYLGDRYNRRWIMALGLAVWSASVFLSTFVPANHFWLFLFCRGVVGIGEASYATISPTIIADLFSKDVRSRMLMVFYFAIPIGSGLGFVVGANVAHLMNDFRWGIRVTPIFGIVCLFLIILVLREPERGQSEEGIEIKPSSFRNDLIHLIKNRSYIWSTIGFTAVVFVAGSMTWWTPNAVIHSVAMKQGHETSDQQKANINLVFGVITCIAGFGGVSIGAFWSVIWRRTNPRADPLVCGIGALAAVPFLYFALTTLHWNLIVGWLFIFFAITLLCLNWSVVVDMLLYIVVPTRRATASAFQILISHLFGDAASPYIIGLVSDALRGSRTDAAAKYYSLQYALYIPNFVLVFGGFFFLGTAWFLQTDRRKAEIETKVVDRPSVTVESGRSGLGQATESSQQLLPANQMEGDIIVDQSLAQSETHVQHEHF